MHVPWVIQHHFWVVKVIQSPWVMFEELFKPGTQAKGVPSGSDNKHEQLALFGLEFGQMHEEAISPSSSFWGEGGFGNLGKVHVEAILGAPLISNRSGER